MTDQLEIAQSDAGFFLVNSTFEPRVQTTFGYTHRPTLAEVEAVMPPGFEPAPLVRTEVEINSYCDGVPQSRTYPIRARYVPMARATARLKKAAV